MYTIESLLHLGNPTDTQLSILNHMMVNGYKKCVTCKNGKRRYFYKA